MICNTFCLLSARHSYMCFTYFYSFNPPHKIIKLSKIIQLAGGKTKIWLLEVWFLRLGYTIRVVSTCVFFTPL
jgi:hypothetical protein